MSGFSKNQRRKEKSGGDRGSPFALPAKHENPVNRCQLGHKSFEYNNLKNSENVKHVKYKILDIIDYKRLIKSLQKVSCQPFAFLRQPVNLPVKLGKKRPEATTIRPEFFAQLTKLLIINEMRRFSEETAFLQPRREAFYRKIYYNA